MVALSHTQKRWDSLCIGNTLEVHDPKKFWTCPVGKQVVTKGILLMDWLSTGITINIDGYCETLSKLRHRIQQWCKGKWSGKVQLRHDSLCPYTSQNLWVINITRACCVSSSSLFTWPGSPWLCSVVTTSRMHYAVSDFCLEHSQAPVHEWYHKTHKEWFCEDAWKLPRRCLDLGGECVELAVVQYSA
jgi:hypothetical protein